MTRTRSTATRHTRPRSPALAALVLTLLVTRCATSRPPSPPASTAGLTDRERARADRAACEARDQRACVRYAEALADRLRSVMTDGELPARPRAERGAGGDAPPPAADVATPPAGEAEPARSPPPSDAAPRR